MKKGIVNKKHRNMTEYYHNLLVRNPIRFAEEFLNINSLTVLQKIRLRISSIFCKLFDRNTIK